MNFTITREMERLEKGMNFLASIGSVSPFVGLFGTVWGIMNSFQSIAESKNTSLAVVAPGIAEALFATALGLAAAIPAVVLAVWLVHGLHPGWAASVVRRVRWGWLATCLGLSVVALVATLVVSAVLPAQGNGAEITGELNSWSRTTRDFLLVVVLLTPLQAAGEEFAFRGYLTQAVGTLVPSRAVAVVVPALLFALAHGAQDPPVFVDRFAFGLVAGFLVLATGGLEAGIAMHVLNNLLAFGMALAFSDMTTAMNPTGGTWWSLPVTLTQSLVYLGVVLWVARRAGIATEGSPTPWGAPRPPGPPGSQGPQGPQGPQGRSAATPLRIGRPRPSRVRFPSVLRAAEAGREVPPWGMV